MSDTGKAVFLSYASQDAEAAKRICDALRAAGVEVWFDQSELVGGDSWDQKIRKQIKECTLLIPIISAATQARREGYFRLEWRLADQRTHLMAKGLPFLLPVVIDDTRDAEAHVPDSFTEVQWTKAAGGEVPPAFVARIARLLSGALPTETGDRRPEAGSKSPNRSNERPRWLFPALGLVGVTLAAGGAWFVFRPASPASGLPSPASLAPPTAAAEIARVRANLRPDEWTRADFDAFTPVADRLIQANPENGEAWALRGIANSLLVIRNLDTGTRPLQAGKEAADRALRLAPGSPLAELSLGLHLVAMISRGGDPLACRVPIDRALAGLPAGENLTRYAELASYWLGYQFAGTEKTARAWLAASPGASFPAWILAQSALVRRQPAEAMKWAAQASVDPEITGVRSFVTTFEANYYLLADLAAAQAALDRVPAGQRSVPRVLATRWLVAMAEHHFDQALQELSRSPDPMLRDRLYHGPKALLAGLAHEAAGRGDVARAQFDEAEKILRTELTADPDNQELRAVLALSLACLGRADEARRELAAVEPLLTGQDPTVYTGHLIALIAQVHGALGEIDRMIPWLRTLFTKPSQLPFTPASLRQDPRFGRYAAEPPVRALLAEFAALDAAAPGAVAVVVVDQKSVAVLAFANLSDDKGNEYFSDGISEELLTVLQKIPGLHVAARTSAFSFKGKNATAQEIGAKLGVANLVDGSVQKSGNRVKVTARLSRVATGEELWSRSYTRELKDAFALQEELATAIVGELSSQLPGGLTVATQVKAAVRGGTTNPEAHQLFLQGRYIQAQFSMENMGKAIGSFERATALDPDFALAWAALSRAHAMHAGWSDRMTQAEFADELAQARRAADRALELQPDMPEALNARFEVQFNYDFDWPGGAAVMERALALAPSDPVLISAASRVAGLAGHGDKAVELLRQAVALDPVNAEIRVYLALALVQVQRWEDARSEFARVALLSPTTPWAYAGAGLTYLYEGRYAEALSTLEHEPTEFARQLVSVIALWGLHQTAKSDAELAQMIKVNGDVGAYQIAEIYGFRGDKEQAFAWLERAHRQRDAGFVVFTHDPFFDSLKGDPRWAAFRKQIGLAGEQLK